jgi:precorrin-2 dehydrogenase / sirohydrochlorin ferrochelatase
VPFYPVNLKLHNKICVIVGGGVVASRKVDSLLLCGAQVRVVSPEVCRKLQLMAEEGKIHWIQRSYESDDLAEAFLVITATDNHKVQCRVVSEAQERNILLNVVDDPSACTFQVPATVRRGEFLLAVSTGGGSPALSAKIRREIEILYGPEYGEFVALLAGVRQQIVADGGTQRSHKNVFEKLLESNILPNIKEQDWSEVYNELTEILPESINIKEILKKN